jgi:hypothetical protein
MPLDRGVSVFELRLKQSDTVQVSLHGSGVDSDCGDDVDVLKRAGQDEILEEQVIVVLAV